MSQVWSSCYFIWYVIILIFWVKDVLMIHFIDLKLRSLLNLTLLRLHPRHHASGKHIGEAKEYAFENYSHLKYVNGYDDVEICAGAGSMGIEILGELVDEGI